MEKRYLTIQIKGTRFSTRPKRNSTKRVAFVAVIPSRLRENVDLFLLLNGRQSGSNWNSKGFVIFFLENYLNIGLESFVCDVRNF